MQIKDIISGFTFSNISKGVIVVGDNKLIDFNNAAIEIFNSLSIMQIGTDSTNFWDYKNIIYKN